jgi:putative membrane protein
MLRYKNRSFLFENKEEIILRDYLALERTRLANERTLLTYIRFSIYLLLAGVAFLQLEGFDSIDWLVYVAFFISGLSLLIGLVGFFRLKNRLNRYFFESNKK